MTKDELLTAAKALPADERADLAAQLWATLEPDDAAPAEGMRLQLDRRLAADRAEPPAATGWDELNARIWGDGF